MQRRGRKLFTRLFFLLTGGVVVAMIASSVFFATESSLAAKRILVLPIIMVAADLVYRFFATTDTAGNVMRFGAILGVPAFFAFMVRNASRMGVFKLLRIPKKLILKFRFH